MTKEQQRARARRRHEERQKNAKPVVTEDKKDMQMVGIIVAVLLIIAAVIVVPLLLPDRAPDTPAASTSTGAATQAAGLQPGQELAAGCTEPPPVQATPKTFAKAPDKATAAGKTWIATVKTTCGDITLELDGAKAPQTVASFLFLAKEGYWAPSPCHRLTSEGLFVLQCGDPTGTGQGDPGYGFGIENVPADGVYPPGSLAMARTQDPNSNGGQFFIAYKETKLPTAGGGYSLFGKVTGGLDIIDKIAAGKAIGATPADGPPVHPISILDVQVTEKKA
ncbi:MAG: peptidylprolyl isomerase [Dermatophilaceae bacterium]